MKSTATWSVLKSDNRYPPHGRIGCHNGACVTRDSERPLNDNREKPRPHAHCPGYMGLNRGRQDTHGPLVGPMNLAIWGLAKRYGKMLRNIIDPVRDTKLSTKLSALTCYAIFFLEKNEAEIVSLLCLINCKSYETSETSIRFTPPLVSCDKIIPLTMCNTVPEKK